MIYQALEELNISEAVFYLDQPVSNSGRLKSLIIEIVKNYNLSIEVEVIYDVDRVLEKKEGVISSDAVILDKCISWFNLNGWITDRHVQQAWVYEMNASLFENKYL